MTSPFPVRAIRAIGNHLPPLPHATAIINRVLKPLYCRFYPGMVRADLFGYEVDLDPAECVDGRALFYPARYDVSEIAFIRSFLSPGERFVDCGANIGFYSFAALSMGAVVTAIEAEPSLAERLKYAFRSNNANGEVVNAAASDIEGTLCLYLNETGNKGGHSISSHVAINRRTISVPALPLSSILRPLGPIKVMKVDIEGAEPRALGELFSSGLMLPRAMIVERPSKGSSDHIALCLENGYHMLRECEENVILML
jgi:FkbM family methyltransferase